jgi:hypothetical protein
MVYTFIYLLKGMEEIFGLGSLWYKMIPERQITFVLIKS